MKKKIQGPTGKGAEKNAFKKDLSNGQTSAGLDSISRKRQVKRGQYVFSGRRRAVLQKPVIRKKKSNLIHIGKFARRRLAAGIMMQGKGDGI